jgi:hypothetical protein
MDLHTRCIGAQTRQAVPRPAGISQGNIWCRGRESNPHDPRILSPNPARDPPSAYQRLAELLREITTFRLYVVYADYAVSLATGTILGQCPDVCTATTACCPSLPNRKNGSTTAPCPSASQPEVGVIHQRHLLVLPNSTFNPNRERRSWGKSWPSGRVPPGIP